MGWVPQSVSGRLRFMDVAAKLISAIAQLLWPLLGFYFLWLFTQQITDILKRLNRATKVKAAGIEIELDKLQERVEKAVQEVVPPALPVPRQPQTRLGKVGDEPAAPEEPVENLILREAAQSPKAALLLLGSEIQKRLRQLLAATNWQQNIKPEPLSEAIEKLRAQGSLPEHVTGSLKLFLDVRNKLIHGEANDDEIFRAIDSGLTLLRAIKSIPAEVNVVYQTGVPLYSDHACTQRITDATGLMLETTSPGGLQTSYRILPTTRTHFRKGKRVAWEWSMGRQWGPAWYRDPTTNEAKQAWVSSTEFIGRHLDDV
jgi:hypothetical protein